MSSTIETRVYSSMNAHNPLERPRLCRFSTRNLSFPRQSLEKAWLASELAMEKPRNRGTGFKCRNCAPGAGTSAIRRKKLAVFVSGGGSNFRSVHEASIGGLVHGDVAVLVTDKPGCGGADYARANGIPVILFPKTKSSAEGLSPVDLITTLRNFKVDFILLAGYLKLIPAELVQAYPKSILNIHPSLLPAFGGKGFYGLKVHRAVIASGARYSGPTVHFVDENFDTGRILAQRVVPVLANDNAEELAARVLHEEHQVYVEVASALCEDRIIWREDGVPLIRSREDPKVYT
ncbi:phosphoribosylglycinamide formyltransferase, chloroplastic-like isoform X1 [Iris pallida]|uniref:Phosphoribosylglycinamide formyltransferase, chloroplastic n=1 Tax=Iris pallida TaxID=29817 RepID=A0AAX6G738_IRIPA|nr:phosphoribosylglycinamide formyltransferase, chloroplastic-like isoform X1 [Iris pallida]